MAGALAAMANEMVAHLPAYSDVIVTVFGVHLFATGATMFGATLFFAARNPSASRMRLAAGAVVIAVVVFIARTLLFPSPRLSGYAWWPMLPIAVHAVIVVPAALLGPAVARRFRRLQSPPNP